MLLVHKIELKPNRVQATQFARACGVARFAWNWALEQWKQEYEAGGKPTEAALRRQLNAIKRDEFPWMLEVSKTVPQQAIKNLGQAFQHFFRRVKQGGKPGYPRFKKKGVHDAFRADNGPPEAGKDAVRVEGKRVRLPKIGWVRMREEVRFKGQIKSVVVSRRADRWYAAFAVETEDLPHASRKSHGGATGVDLGVSYLATLSDGTRITGPKPHAALLKRLRRESRQLSRKRKGSANWRKAVFRIARLHARIANIRTDALHKLTTRLVLDYDLIGIEDLNVRGMSRNRHLARALMDQAFSEFRRQLEYKAVLYGVQIVVADRFFPSSKTCCLCGAVRDMPLHKRVYRCACGNEMDRDVNAAINLKHLAEKALRQALPEVTPVERTALAGGGNAFGETGSVKQEANSKQICTPSCRFA